MPAIPVAWPEAHARHVSRSAQFACCAGGEGLAPPSCPFRMRRVGSRLAATAATLLVDGQILLDDFWMLANILRRARILDASVINNVDPVG